ncbi:MAG: PEP-CTERM sorting domain-containing protein [Phycisphaeraceae bacterium]
MKLHAKTLLAGLAATALVGAANAAVVLDANLFGSFSNTTSTASQTESLTFNSAGSDKIVVTISTRVQSSVASVTYSGESLTEIGSITNGNMYTGIWYTDAATLSNGDLVFSPAAGDFGLRGSTYGIYALSGTTDGTALDFGGSTTSSVTLDAPEGAFVVGTFGTEANDTGTVNAPLTQAGTASANTGGGAQGYDELVSSSDASATYSIAWVPGTSTNLVTYGAVFVPEPGSLALLGLGGLMMIKRRRRG